MNRGVSRWPKATVVTLFLSGNLVLIGAVMLLRYDSETVRQYGLLMWLVGAMTAFDLVVLSRGGRPMHVALVLAAAAGIHLAIYQSVPQQVTSGIGKVLLIALTAVFAIMAFIPWDLIRSSPATLFQELADEARVRAMPERPADPAAEIARIQGIISGHIEEFRAQQPRDAREMLELLERYRADHGTDTIRTSSRPTALRNAVEVLVEDFERIHLQLTARTGSPHAIVALSYTRLMSDLVADRTR